METDNDVQRALIDLYLNVKIRNAEELREFSNDKFEEERKALKDTSSLLLVDYIRTSVEILINLRKDEDALINVKDESILNESIRSLKEISKHYEDQLQKLEEEVRSHIRVLPYPH
jgi:hypothetical protein